FVDGTPQGQLTLTKPVTYDASIPWTIGSTSASFRSAGVPRTWNGVIDEVGIYNRALSQAEIQALVSAGNAGLPRPQQQLTYALDAGPAGATFTPSTGFVGSWQGEGNARNGVNPNHGTPQGGVTFAPGRVGQAFQLDGLGAHVNAGNDPALQVSAGEFSAGAWVNFSTLTH